MALKPMCLGRIPDVSVQDRCRSGNMRWRQPTFCACNQRWNACAWTAVRAAKDKLDCGAQQLKFGAAVLGAAALLATTAPGPASASDKVGEFTASGFLFKDSVEVVTVEDSDVPGVRLYISDFKRSLPDKLAKDFFSEPSQASVTCAATGPLSVPDVSRIRGAEGHEVFSERKGLNLFKNKTLRVRRLLDEKNQTLLYVAYSTRLNSSQDDGISSGRYRTSICALPLISAPTSAGAGAAEGSKVPALAPAP